MAVFYVHISSELRQRAKRADGLAERSEAGLVLGKKIIRFGSEQREHAGLAVSIAKLLVFKER